MLTRLQGKEGNAMRVLIRMVVAWVRWQLSRTLEDVLDNARPVSAGEARSVVKAWIQGRTWLPGEVRAWLCEEVDVTEGDTVDAFRTALRQRLGA